MAATPLALQLDHCGVGFVREPRVWWLDPATTVSFAGGGSGALAPFRSTLAAPSMANQRVSAPALLGPDPRVAYLPTGTAASFMWTADGPGCGFLRVRLLFYNGTAEATVRHECVLPLWQRRAELALPGLGGHTVTVSAVTRNRLAVDGHSVVLTIEQPLLFDDGAASREIILH